MDSDGCGGQNRVGIPFWGIGAPPILEPILVGIGMLTGGTGGTLLWIQFLICDSDSW